MSIKKTLSVAGLTVGIVSGAYAANEGPGPAGDVAAFSASNRGSVLCVASINSTGSVAGGTNVNKAINTRIGVGVYNVRFSGICGGNIRVNNGWARWVQVDTLAFGTTDGTCTTADLAATGGSGGIWVDCFDRLGNHADRSFNLFVAR